MVLDGHQARSACALFVFRRCNGVWSGGLIGGSDDPGCGFHPTSGLSFNLRDTTIINAF